MTEGTPGDAAVGHVDADLLEYLLVVVPAVERVADVAVALAELVRSETIRLIDVVLLHRARGQTAVAVSGGLDAPEIAPLARSAVRSVRLSAHDVALAAVVVEPDVSALLLLVEDRWAGSLSAAARQAGGRLLCGERVGRDRYGAAVDRAVDGVDRRWIPDLLVRGPASGADPELAVDPAAQLHALAELVDRGVLTLQQYELQRRRVLDG
ncbi:hypothetical protein MWU57_16120 [Isoptericola sp. S6320L]|uniref:hypothetical protein n=1 Tax=Isoptericola sp. S6320L TaxID=2926411 RepID=UPI001FF1033D|nr:hypothetical protein [Isoptericola sp. S6320L]MCK0118554.1 hypothetical protein [Isoptericola sp. S6320L]